MTCPPYPLHVIHSTYLQETLHYIIADTRRLQRLAMLCDTMIVRKLFAASFWLFVIHLQKYSKEKENEKKLEKEESGRDTKRSRTADQ